MVGGFVPDKRLGVFVVVLDEGANGAVRPLVRNLRDGIERIRRLKREFRRRRPVEVAELIAHIENDAVSGIDDRLPGIQFVFNRRFPGLRRRSQCEPRPIRVRRFFRFWYVALRIVTGGSGLFLPLAQLSAAALRRLVDQVLDTRSYREWALAMMVAITNVNGLAMAAELIERVFGANHPITELRTTDR